MKFFSKLKRYAIGTALCLGIMPSAFAEGGVNDTAIDVSDATGFITSLKSAWETYWEQAKPVLTGILGAALVVVLIYVAYKFFTKGAKKVG